MKKILLLLTLIFTITTSAQYTILSAIDINEGMEDQYLQLEEFFGPVHDLAIKKGIQDPVSYTHLTLPTKRIV